MVGRLGALWVGVLAACRPVEKRPNCWLPWCQSVACPSAGSACVRHLLSSIQGMLRELAVPRTKAHATRYALQI